MGLEAQTCYADSAAALECPIVENVQIAERTYRVRIVAPDVATSIVPGQFVMLRLPTANDPLLGRPFALYDVIDDGAGQPFAIDIVYLVLGKMTSGLSDYQSGDRLQVWGPLGNGFPQLEVEHLIMVAGGIGQTPFLAVGKEFLGLRDYRATPQVHERAIQADRRATLCYGVRHASLLAGAEDFADAGIDLRVASDDGSIGHHGFVTDVLKEALSDTAGQSRAVFCCGPEPMMAAVSEICAVGNVPCYASLETPMACGIGICFSCVAPIKDQDNTWDYRRTCVDGPIFDAAAIDWEQMAPQRH